MDINEINKEIECLEKREYTTYGNCYKLAVLYIVRDHFPKEEKKKMMSINEQPTMTTATLSHDMPVK